MPRVLIEVKRFWQKRELLKDHDRLAKWLGRGICTQALIAVNFVHAERQTAPDRMRLARDEWGLEPVAWTTYSGMWGGEPDHVRFVTPIVLRVDP